MQRWRLAQVVLVVALLQLGDVLSAQAGPPPSEETSHAAAEVASACKRGPGGSSGLECAPPPPTGRKVCGTDNNTYDSVCLLRRARCQGRAVELRHRGPCRDPQPCLADLARYYLQQRAGSAQVGAARSAGQGGLEGVIAPEGSTHLPICRKDGSYAAVQCHNLTGYCWCVTRRGRFVKGSTVKGSRPKCARAMKTRRGSSPGHRLHKRGCGHMERSTFNSNLVKIFRQEFERSGDATAGTDAPAGQDDGGDADLNPNRRVLDWKFAVLDSDEDGILRRPEYSDLRRLVRKVVKPKRCARAFGRLCDLDRDRNISRQEWAACFGLDFSLLQESARRSEPGGAPVRGAPSRGGPPLKDDTDDEDDGVIGDPKSDLHEAAALFPLDRSGNDNSETEATDCITDRQAVLDEQRSLSATSHDPYVPECTPDGRYNRKQCYNSTGYCWCVYEDSGKPIPGTSVRNQNPSCDLGKAEPRPFTGCPEPAKQIFLENLIEFLRSRMSLMPMPAKTGPSVLKSPEDEVERIVTWTFAQFDANKNKVLERREWKAFRLLVSESKKLKRCGRRLPRYCDLNHDRKISMTEWLDCTRPREGAPRSQHWPVLSSEQIGPGGLISDDNQMSGTGMSPNIRGSRRKGLNPVERYLKP